MTANNDDSKIKVLRQLARTSGETATSALEREAQKVLSALDSESRYDILSRQIELLDVFAFRVPDTAVAGVARFLLRLETIEVDHDVDHLLLVDYETRERLAVASLELLSRLRYYRLPSPRLSPSNTVNTACFLLECLHISESRQLNYTSCRNVT